MVKKVELLLQDKTNKYILGGLILSGLLMVLMNSSGSNADSTGSEDSTPFTADTIIPAGYVLVPIEIQNIDSLASMIGQFGVIDLFTTPHPGQKSGIRVGRKLKLLRAPLNPQQFAVLVPENEASLILQTSGPFTAVVQNPANRGQSEFIEKKQQPKIEYFKGGHK